MIESCHECGGAVVPVTAPGRTRQYRAVTVVVPADLAIHTCQGCGRTYVTSAELKDMSVWCEAQYQAMKNHE